MDIWDGLSRFANIAAVLTLPATAATTVPIYLGWGVKMKTYRKIIAGCFGFLAISLYIIDISDRFGFFRKEDAPFNVQTVYQKKYSNEVVILDNTAYYDCSFENVTFRWNGGYTMLINAKITGKRIFESQNSFVVNSVDLMKVLGELDPEFAASWLHYGADHFK